MLSLILAAVLVSPNPEPTLFMAPCSESAWGVTDQLEIFLKRGDRERALSILVAAGKAQEECSKQWRTNYGGRYNMWGAAAQNYARAADIAVHLHRYALARSLAQASTRMYRIMQAHPYGDFSADPRDIEAEITANNDLLARLPHKMP